MPDAYFFPSIQSQEGFTQPGVNDYEWNWFGGHSFDVGRQFMTRFSDVDLPVGATITNATVIYKVTAKNPQDAQTITFDYYYEQTSAGSGIMNQYCLPLRRNTAEENRPWAIHSAGIVYSWPSTPAPQTNLREMTVDVTSRVQQAWTTYGGRHMELAFRLVLTAETADMEMGTATSGKIATLRITYSGGTGQTQVVHVNENSNFNLGTWTNDDGLVIPNCFHFNSFYGSYGTPNYQVMSEDGSIVAPYGGNILKITTTQADKHTAIFFENFMTEGYGNIYRLTPGEWLTLGAYVWVPEALDQVKCVVYPAAKENYFTTSLGTKGSWAHIYISFQYSIDYTPWIGFQSHRTKPAVGQFWYLANPYLIRNRQETPYFDGSTTDEPTKGRAFDWAGGNSGRPNGGRAYMTVTAVPSATMQSPLPSASTYKNIYATWTYNDGGSNESQVGFRVEMRKKKVQK